MGHTLQDKQDADCRLLHNFYMLFDEAKDKWLAVLRDQRAINYYEMVLVLGKNAFEKGKVVSV